ncbi:UvrABC system protein [Trichinella spiralis]|uniref:UvrABC system protein n=1 Tax=Trichinella spiralis TaxID=6334 RepID=A0ABR3KZZ6_TRISP
MQSVETFWLAYQLHAITVDPSFSSHSSETKRSKQLSCNHAGVDLTRYNGPDASGLTDITHRRSLADTIVGPAHHDNADWQRPAKSMPVTIKRLESFLADSRARSMNKNNKATSYRISALLEQDGNGSGGSTVQRNGHSSLHVLSSNGDNKQHSVWPTSTLPTTLSPLGSLWNAWQFQSHLINLITYQRLSCALLYPESWASSSGDLFSCVRAKSGSTLLMVLRCT